jgi:hypothetical protein
MVGSLSVPPGLLRVLNAVPRLRRHSARKEPPGTGGPKVDVVTLRRSSKSAAKRVVFLFAQ